LYHTKYNPCGSGDGSDNTGNADCIGNSALAIPSLKATVVDDTNPNVPPLTQPCEGEDGGNSGSYSKEDLPYL